MQSEQEDGAREEEGQQNREYQARLDRLRESVDVSARNFHTVYTFYLLIVFYTIVIVSSTDHELLFRAGDVRMPIINITVSVVWFFVVAPWLLLILHFNLLIQGLFLSQKISRYKSTLSEQTMHQNSRVEALSLLFPVPLAHVLTKADRHASTQILLNTMVFISIVVLLPGILIYTQLQFLLYQDELYTWLHRTAVVADIILLWYFWPRIIAPDKKWSEWCRAYWSEFTKTGWQSPKPYLRCLAPAVMTVATLVSVVFVIALADFPGGSVSKLGLDYISKPFQYDLSDRVLVDSYPPPEVLSAILKKTCNRGDSGDAARCRDTAVSVGSTNWCERAKPLQLKGRNFRGANLKGAKLCGVVFENADLQGADMSGAKLQGANLKRAKLNNVNLEGAELHNIDMSNAELQDVKLGGAELFNANLSHAVLHKADLSKTKLYGAQMLKAKLHKVNLKGAELYAADLRGAELDRADLHCAGFQGADLSQARFDCAKNLENAKFLGALLDNTKFENVGQAKINRSISLDNGKKDELKWRIEKIGSDYLREVALTRIKWIENGEANIESQSIKDTGPSEKENLHTECKDI